MILVGNQRGGAWDRALHLMKDENESVVDHDLRGFVGDDLTSAFRKSQAISRATRCRQHLYSLSMNPPRGALVDPDIFEAAIERAEQRLGLTGQPPAIVFFEKRGFDGEVRRHAYAVWCRIDPESMIAVHLPHTKRKLQELARELYLENDWQMPRGFVRQGEADPRNYKLTEWQQAKRAQNDPCALKASFQDCWVASDSKAAFARALRERGLILARGDRGRVIAVDRDGDVYAVARWVGIKTKQVRERITDLNGLPDVAAAKAEAAGLVASRLTELRSTEADTACAENERHLKAKAALGTVQGLERLELLATQRTRRTHEQTERDARIRKGWRGLIDRLTGKRRRIERENRVDAEKSQRHDTTDFADLTTAQTEDRQTLLERIEVAKASRRETLRKLDQDIERLEHARSVGPDPNDDPPYKLASTDRRRRRRKRTGPNMG